MTNNRGQVLVVFLIFVPVLIFLVTFMVDYGTSLSEKKNIEATMREAINYGFNNSDDPEIEQKILIIIEHNVSDTQNVNIDVRPNTIIIEFTKKMSFMNIMEDTNFRFIGTKDVGNKITIIEE